MMRSVGIIALFLSAGAAVAESGESLKQLEVGSYAELAARPNPQGLALQYIPSLAAIFLSTEKKKGSSLTREEVEAIRDQASVMAVQPNAAKAVDDQRGYKDIYPPRAWEEWQLLRVQFQLQK